MMRWLRSNSKDVFELHMSKFTIEFLIQIAEIAMVDGDDIGETWKVSNERVREMDIRGELIGGLGIWTISDAPVG